MVRRSDCRGCGAEPQRYISDTGDETSIPLWRRLFQRIKRELTPEL
jgi:hypothetical protein